MCVFTTLSTRYNAVRPASNGWVKAVTGQASDITELPSLCKYGDYLAAGLIITKDEAQVQNDYSAVIKTLTSTGDWRSFLKAYEKEIKKLSTWT